MVKETKLYDLLGVKPDANENEIKKGYRKAALKYHPDKPTGDTEKFKEISEAFDILSNSDKRQIYDAYGLEAARHGGVMPDAAAGGAGGPGGAGGFPGGFPGGDGGGGFAGFGGMPGGGGGGRTFRFTTGGGPGGPGGGYSFSSGDAFNIFNHFSQAGGMDGDDDDDIFSMLNGGRGGRRAGASAGGFPGGFGRSASPPEKEKVTLKLPVSLEDLASGTTKKMKIKRKNANGQQEERVLNIQIKPGWKAGTKITYPNEGDGLPDGSRQDVVFVIDEKPNAKFTRDGNDLKMTLHLTLKEALCGFSKIVETIDGKKLKVEYSRPITPGNTVKYPSHGMPLSKNPSERGSLILTFEVDMPRELTPAQREAIEKNF